MRAEKFEKVIMISPMGGKIYTPLGAWYHATKHAVEGLSDCLTLELKLFGIDVVVIEPGIIQTEFGDVIAGPKKKFSGAGSYAEMVDRVVNAMQNPIRTVGVRRLSPLRMPLQKSSRPVDPRRAMRLEGMQSQ